MASTDTDSFVNRVKRTISRVQQSKPMRVFTRYGQRGGPLLAQGLSYQSIFATFAAIWVSFSVAGFVVQSNPELLGALIDNLSTSIPGLIDTGDGNGALKISDLLNTGTLSWTGSIALVGLLLTAIGWLSAARQAVRGIFDANFLLLKLKDLGLGIGFGVAVIVSSALTVFSTQALGSALNLLGIREGSVVSSFAVQAVVLVLTFALDTAVLMTLYRVLAGIPVPLRRLLGGSLLGAALIGVLKVLGSSLLGGASSNPLLAGFAVIIGLLIWFNLICQVILAAASWIAVDMKDAGIPFDPEGEARDDAAEAEGAAAGAVAGDASTATSGDAADASTAAKRDAADDKDAGPRPKRVARLLRGIRRRIRRGRAASTVPRK